MVEAFFPASERAVGICSKLIFERETEFVGIKRNSPLVYADAMEHLRLVGLPRAQMFLVAEESEFLPCPELRGFHLYYKRMF